MEGDTDGHRQEMPCVQGSGREAPDNQCSRDTAAEDQEEALMKKIEYQFFDLEHRDTGEGLLIKLGPMPIHMVTLRCS